MIDLLTETPTGSGSLLWEGLLPAGVSCRVLDARRLGLLEEILDAELYVLCGVGAQAPAMPAVYVGQSSALGLRWEVSHYHWTRVRRALQATHVVLLDPVDGWSDAERLVVETHVIRGAMSLGGLRLLNSVTAAPSAWAALSPARAGRALAQADGIVDLLAAGPFAGLTGGGLAASDGGGARDATVRHLYQRGLPASELDLAAEDRLRGWRTSSATPWNSCRVDLARREMLTGRPRVQQLTVKGRSYFAPVTQPESQAGAQAASLLELHGRARAAVRAALLVPAAGGRGGRGRRGDQGVPGSAAGAGSSGGRGSGAGDTAGGRPGPVVCRCRSPAPAVRSCAISWSESAGVHLCCAAGAGWLLATDGVGVAVSCDPEAVGGLCSPPADCEGWDELDFGAGGSGAAAR